MEIIEENRDSSWRVHLGNLAPRLAELCPVSAASYDRHREQDGHPAPVLFSHCDPTPAHIGSKDRLPQFAAFLTKTRLINLPP